MRESQGTLVVLVSLQLWLAGEALSAPSQPGGSTQAKGVPANKGTAPKASPLILPRTFTFKNAKCTVDLPKSYTTTQRDTSVGRMFFACDPAKSKAEIEALSLAIVPATNKNPQVNEFLDGVLDPYRTRLKDFKEQKNADETISGRVFASRRFSGSFGDVRTTGFVYGTLDQNSYVVMIGEVNGKAGNPALEKLLKAARTYR